MPLCRNLTTGEVKSYPDGSGCPSGWVFTLPPVVVDQVDRNWWVLMAIALALIIGSRNYDR